jgi:hypothetical protein
MTIFDAPSFVLHVLPSAGEASHDTEGRLAAARNFALLTLEFIVPTIKSNLFIMINRTKPVWWKTSRRPASVRRRSRSLSVSQSVSACLFPKERHFESPKYVEAG